MKRLPYLALSVLLLCLSGCAEQKSAPEERCKPLTELIEPENALSEELMASLGQAQNFHRKADVHISSGAVDEAAASLLMIFDIPFPEGSPEAEDVILDTRARLAKLRVIQGKLDEAMTLVDEGISESRRESFFLANLYTVRGEVFMARAALAEESSPEAREAKTEAIKAFDASIKINEAILKTLGTGDAQ